MNKYPYIARAKKSGSACVVFDYGKCVCIESKDSNFEFGEVYDVDESVLFNITAEYLANTKVKIKSEEHAEFIIKLFNNAFDIGAVSRNPKWIYNKGEAGVTQQFHGEPSGELKLITIPLPPKEESMSKEWPQVGDDVLYDGSSDRFESIKGEVSKVIAKYSFEGSDYITIKHHNEGVFAMVAGSWLRKPQTPEEELNKSILKFLECGKTYDRLAKAIINGEIEGLSYKPE